MLGILLELSNHQAWYRGFANRRPDGNIVQTKRNFHVNHLNPVSKTSASHQITDCALLHLAECRQEIADAGEMMVNSANDLINPAKAHQRALERWALDRAEQGRQLNLAERF